MRRFFALTIASSLLALVTSRSTAAEPLQFGFSKVDITPQQPLRLSGYGNRATPSEGVVQKLWVRTLVLKPPDGQPAALVSVDTIGFPGVLTTSIARRLEKKYGIPRERFVQCSTHSHTAPQLADGLTNIFATPLTDEERSGMRRYSNRVADSVVAGVGKALDDLTPGRMFLATGKVGFAANRRLLANGRWTGFGVNEKGPVDHALPVLKIVDADGALRGVVFNYACHCTTLGPNFNRVCGDWAGYAQQFIEESNPGTVALCTIGCGADANPQPRGELQMARAHGRAIALEVDKLLRQAAKQVEAAPVASFGYVGLPVDRPDISELRGNLDHDTPQVRRHAENLVAIYRRMGRLPESYPMPIQTWKFADELTMVFLGGEVVVDYSHRLRQELKEGYCWITAYANDVFGYVASERLRREGGYEVDYSMTYYNQPGPWAEGTEEIVIRRVHEILNNPQAERSLSPGDALQSFHLPVGYEIELVAAEPLIVDPVNFAFGADGRLWVVQMSDYPRGADDRGRAGGVVKFLEDTDRDGRFDVGTVFVDGLNYPTGVMPWRDGVLISGAPDLLYAEDTDGDGRADVRKVLYTGFVQANPQHRINGFAYGLDNWVYLASGDSGGDVRSTVTGEVINTSGRDIRIRPDDGAIDTVSGRTQYGRTRNDWGDWFGSSNNHPIFHFVIADRYLRRNRYVPAPSSRVDLIRPTPAPPVYPASRTLDRFNDLYDANRFTSACGPAFFRDVSLGQAMSDSALVCEPVHNLVHRTLVESEGVTFRGERHPDEQRSEFLASTDVWFRPVMLKTGPDGALWVADMYRYVIEHPQWIPEEWQQRLDIRAGEDRGRIYRVYRAGRRPGPLPVLSEKSTHKLAALLESANGTIRDSAQRLLVHRGDAGVAARLETLAATSDRSAARLHALATLHGMQALQPRHLHAALDDEDWRVQRLALRLSEPLLNEHPKLAQRLARLTEHPDIRLRFQLALSLGAWDDPRAGRALGRLAVDHPNNRWMQAAILSASTGHAERILTVLLRHRSAQQTEARLQLVEHLIATALGNNPETAAPDLLEAIAAAKGAGVKTWQIGALAAFFEAAGRRGVDLAPLRDESNVRGVSTWRAAGTIHETARRLAADSHAPLADRQTAVRLLGSPLGDEADDKQRLASLLSPQTPPSLQEAALARLTDLRSDDVAELMLGDWRSHSPMLRERILTALLSRRDWTARLLDALETGHVLPADFDAAARSRLLSHPSERIRERAEKLLASLVSRDRQQVIAAYQDALEIDGNLIRGATVFSRRCATCHRFRGRGNEIGPKLEALRDKSSRHLLVSILDPNRAVERAYLEYVVATVDGRLVGGMVVAESSNSFTMAQPDGRKQAILRADVEHFARTGKSFMPEGLERDLSKQDLADLFAFLQSAPQTAVAAEPDSSRRMLDEAGLNGLARLESTGPRRTQSTWLGEIAVPYCGGDSSQPLLWRTAPVPNDAAGGGMHLFRLAAAMGGRDGSGVPLMLQVDSQTVLEFTLRGADATYASPDGRAVLRYLVLQKRDEGSSGVLEIELAASLLQPGEPAELTVVPAQHPPSASLSEPAAAGWFGVLPVE